MVRRKLAGQAFRSTPKAQTEEEHQEEHKATPQIKAVLHLEKFIVNLADAEVNRFLRVEIDLGVKKEPESSGHGDGNLSSTARIRDTILAVLATWESQELATPEGKTKLKEHLIQALRERAPELGIEEVYFTDFLVQH